MSRFLRPLAFGLVGALIAVGVYALIDNSSGGGGPAKAAASTPTSTTAPPAIGEKVYQTIEPSANVSLIDDAPSITCSAVMT